MVVIEMVFIEICMEEGDIVVVKMVWFGDFVVCNFVSFLLGYFLLEDEE